MEIPRLVPSDANENRLQRQAVRHSITCFGNLYQEQLAKDRHRYYGSTKVTHTPGQGLHTPLRVSVSAVYIHFEGVPRDKIIAMRDVRKVVRHPMSCCRACGAFYATTTPYFHEIATFHKKITKQGGDSPSPWCDLFLTGAPLSLAFSAMLRPCLTSLPEVTTVRYEGQSVHPRMSEYLGNASLQLEGRLYCERPGFVWGPSEKYAQAYPSHPRSALYVPECAIYGYDSWVACRTRFFVIYPLLDQLVKQYVQTEPYGPDFYSNEQFTWQTAFDYARQETGRDPPAGLISREAFFVTADLLIMFLFGDKDVVRPLPAISGLRSKGFRAQLSTVPLLVDDIKEVVSHSGAPFYFRRASTRQGTSR